MKTIRVTVSENPVKISPPTAMGAICNFQVTEVDYDLGGPIGNGGTLEAAIEDFKESWEMKFDEEIQTEIV